MPSARGALQRWWPSVISCAGGKRLENWELDYYRTHRAVVELRGVESAEEQAEKRRLLELLGG